MIVKSGSSSKFYDDRDILSLRVHPTAPGTTIEGFRLDGYTEDPLVTDQGPTIYADDVVLRENEITNEGRDICVQVGRYFDGPRPEDVVIERNLVHDCGVRPATNYDHGIYISGALRTVIRDNWIYDNADRGVQLYPDADQSLISGNIIDGNGQGLNLSCNGAKPEEEVDNCSEDNVVEGNVIANSNVSWNVYGHTQKDGLLPHGSNVLRDNCVYASPQATASYQDHAGVSADTRFFIENTNDLLNNENEAPRYRDRNMDDFHLLDSSPCLRKYTGTMSLLP